MPEPPWDYKLRETRLLEQTRSQAQETKVGAFRTFIAIVATLFIVYHLLYTSDILTLVFHIGISLRGHVGFHLGLVLFLAYLVTPAGGGARRKFPPWYDIILAFLSLIPPLYYSLFYGSRIAYHMGELLPEHVLMGWLLVVLVVEAGRRLLGWIFASISVIFIVYALFGNYFPGLLHTRGYGFDLLGEYLYFGSSGIMGVPIVISATVIVLFLFFSQVMSATGAGKFFMDIAYSLLGQVRGGPAKGAVVASAALGTLSGAPTGNVASVGVFTIPLMKSIGYKAEVAGGIEAVASLGAMFMPPVMGAVIFILAEFIEMPYIEVATRSFIAAVLYYLALFIQIDLEAAKAGMRGLSRKDLPPLLKTLRGGFWYLLPLVVIIYLLAGPMYTAEKSVLGAMVVLIFLSMFTKRDRFTFKKFVDSSVETVQVLLMVAVACAAAGIVIGSVAITGLGNTLSMKLVEMAGGNLFLLLIVAGIASFVMGTGIGPTATYIFLAILVAPALVAAGTQPLAAHLFVFYFGMVALITPPVCETAFVAAAIAKADPMMTGVQATRLGAAAYLVPFSFALSPALLLYGSPGGIAVAVLTATVGIGCLAVFAVGFLLTKVPWLQRVLYLPAAVMLIMPSLTFDFIGLGILGVALLWHILSAKRAAGTRVRI